MFFSECPTARAEITFVSYKSLCVQTRRKFKDVAWRLRWAYSLLLKDLL